MERLGLEAFFARAHNAHYKEGGFTINFLIVVYCLKMMMNCCDCRKRPSCDTKLKRELWRLRLNWFFISFMAILASVSNTAITASFHQFVINPRDTGNPNDKWDKNEYGLGQSETFYTWCIAVFNFGSVFGAIISGLFVKYIPYWYLFGVSLSTHIVGYILCAVTYEPWLVVVSKILSGYFLGAQWTAAFSYSSKSSIEYVELMRKMGKKIEEDAAERVKGYLFTAQTFGIGLGYIVGPGTAVVFAQFPIDQFRAIAWYNVAVGVALLTLQVFIFRGEMKCEKLSEFRNFCHCMKEKTKEEVKNGYLGTFIIVSFLAFRLIAAFRFGVFETLFNPLLSDSFGLDENISSYYFLALVVPYLGGSVILVILQKIKIPNQIIAIIGILMTFAACILLADWQAIPYDPCTEYSPFHHPEIVKNASTLEDHSQIESITSDFNLSSSQMLKGLHTHSSIELDFKNGPSKEINLPPLEVKLNCEHVGSCMCRPSDSISSQQCLFYAFDKLGNLKSSFEKTEQDSNQFLCETNSTFLEHSFSICVHLYQDNINNLKHPKEILQTSLKPAEIQKLKVLTNTSYVVARKNCMHANVSNHQCHWIPSSLIAKKECKDCQPICRSIHQTMTFYQFIFGSELIMTSIPVLWVPVVGMVSYQVPSKYQGLIMGALSIMNSAARGLGPLFLDPAYEGMQKRTFLAMIILIVIHVPFLVEILVLYRKLGPLKARPPTDLGYSKIADSAQGSDSDECECE